MSCASHTHTSQLQQCLLEVSSETLPQCRDPFPGLCPTWAQPQLRGHGLRGVANLGLELSVLGERALQPCDTERFTEITFLGSLREV